MTSPAPAGPEPEESAEALMEEGSEAPEEEGTGASTETPDAFVPNEPGDGYEPV